MQTNPLINPSNWNYCSYQSADYKAFVSYGAECDSHGPQVQVTEKYYVTVTDHEGIEMFQRSFSGLEQAIEHLNRAYGKLEFKSLSQKAEGCSTCQAH